MLGSKNYVNGLRIGAKALKFLIIREGERSLSGIDKS